MGLSAWYLRLPRTTIPSPLSWLTLRHQRSSTKYCNSCLLGKKHVDSVEKDGQKTVGDVHLASPSQSSFNTFKFTKHPILNDTKIDPTFQRSEFGRKVVGFMGVEKSYMVFMSLLMIILLKKHSDIVDTSSSTWSTQLFIFSWINHTLRLAILHIRIVRLLVSLEWWKLIQSVKIKARMQTGKRYL